MNQETDRNNYYDRARFGGGGGSFRGRIRNGFFKQRNEWQLLSDRPYDLISKWFVSKDENNWTNPKCTPETD